MKRIRWQADADVLGMIIGQYPGTLNEWIVMWSTDGRRSMFSCHLGDALMTINHENMEEVRSRCTHAS